MIDGPAMQTIGTAAFVSLLLALVFFPPLGLLLGYIGLPIALFICMIPLYQGRRKVLARKRRWQALRGECPHCGYDLRQSTGQCPECGEMIASPGL
ncbi:MAG TPA: hypothetical protein VFE47_19090 [Tepidisphaeraceae bacterium]|jgi:hypothetical protein|nr:hypothetical protein [Tepidisphaeraceae bacterium]